MLNRRCIFLTEGAIKFLSWRKLASVQGVNQGHVAGQGSGGEDLGRGGCEAMPRVQGGSRVSAQLGIGVHRHPQILPRDHAAPGGSGLRWLRGPELLVMRGERGAPSQPGDGVSNPQDRQGSRADHPDLLPAIRSPEPWGLLCLPTVVCPWIIALPFGGVILTHLTSGVPRRMKMALLNVLLLVNRNSG